jgi:hypothetical protein
LESFVTKRDGGSFWNYGMIQKRPFFQAFDKNGLIYPNVAKAGGVA